MQCQCTVCGVPLEAHNPNLALCTLCDCKRIRERDALEGIFPPPNYKEDCERMKELLEDLYNEYKGWLIEEGHIGEAKLWNRVLKEIGKKERSLKGYVIPQAP